MESTESTFHAVQSSVLQFALHEDTAPGFTKRRIKSETAQLLHSAQSLPEKKRFPSLAEKAALN